MLTPVLIMMLPPVLSFFKWILVKPANQ